MDEKQLQYEFLSILSERHPGLTFEEYRDSCVFLLFYQYLCLKHGDSLEEAYKPGELVKMAIRGKLQVASFLKFKDGWVKINIRWQITILCILAFLVSVSIVNATLNYVLTFLILLFVVNSLAIWIIGIREDITKYNYKEIIQGITCALSLGI